MAAAQEERFSRKKHDSAFPARSIRYCLSEASISLADLDHVIFYDKPLVKFERLLETYLGYAPRGLHSFIAAMPVWLKEKLYLKATLAKIHCAGGSIGTRAIASSRNSLAWRIWINRTMIDLIKDLWGFMRERKKFWLAPIIIIMLLLGALVVLSQGSAIAPFIYTLF